jgi:branched-chain amino acid transport system permease protein
MNMSSLITTLLDGLAYGVVLFIISVGLTVTMGLMRVVNLAHGGFAMAGGYFSATMSEAGLPFFPAVLVGTLVAGVLGSLAEILLFRQLYRKGHLAQVLMTFGLTFVMIAGLTALFGVNTKPLPVPESLSGLTSIGFRSYPTYRLFLIAVGIGLALGLWLLVDRSLFGARLRAAVDNPRIARAVGIDVNRLSTVTFGLGCALAGFGGAIGAEMLPLEPFYALRYLVLFLVVVAVGGLGSFKGSFIAALAIGLIDTMGKFYIPVIAPYLMFLVVIAILLWRPYGLMPVKSLA